MADIPTTTIFSLILSLFGFFATVTSIALYYHRRDSRRLERLEFAQRATEGHEITFGAHWLEKPVIWDVWANRYPEPTSKWEDLLPLNMTYNYDRPSTRWSPLRQSPLLPAPKARGVGWRSVGGAAGVQLRPRESSERLRQNLVTTDCNISVFIIMPTSRKQLSTEFGDEFAIGTAEVMYRHPKHSHS